MKATIDSAKLQLLANWEEKYGSVNWHWLWWYVRPEICREELKPVLLDGLPVLPDAIDPIKHEFFGSFRPATYPPISIGDDGYHSAKYEWDTKGSFDLLSYRTIKQESKR